MQAEKIALITDSTCDLSMEFLKEHNIKFLPLKVLFGEEEFIDRVNVEPSYVCERMAHELPKTSMPSLGEAMAVFEELEKDGFTHVIAIHISSGLSGTYEIVLNASKQFPSVISKVIDSKCLSVALGILVREAAFMIREGRSYEYIVDEIKGMQSRTKVFFVVKTLEYLIKGGRIGTVEGTLGKILNVKPIISINDEGIYYTYAKVRGRKKSLDKIVEVFNELNRGKRVKLGVAHSASEEEARAVLDAILNNSGVEIKESFFAEMGPGMVVHTGPGLVGVAFCEM